MRWIVAITPNSTTDDFTTDPKKGTDKSMRIVDLKMREEEN